MNNIKVGDIIYRIYPSGAKKLGIASTIKREPGGFPYSWNNPEDKWDAFFSLESYDKEGGQDLYDGYGVGFEKFKYIKCEIQLLPKPIAEKMALCPYLSDELQPIPKT